ncbi:MAG: PAS domain S-box protein, partial [Deltaproteobacteria bacterium]
MVKGRLFSKPSHRLVLWVLLVGALSIVSLSAYHFHLYKAGLKQQTLSGLANPEYLLTSMDLLKTKMLLSLLVVSGLAAILLYGGTTRIIDPVLKHLQDALRESEEKCGALFEGSKEPLFITTQDGKFVDLNGAAVELFGYDAKEELLNIEVAQTY